MTLYLIVKEAQMSHLLAVNAGREHTLIVFTSNGSTDGQHQSLNFCSNTKRNLTWTLCGWPFCYGSPAEDCAAHILYNFSSSATVNDYRQKSIKKQQQHCAHSREWWTLCLNVSMIKDLLCWHWYPHGQCADIVPMHFRTSRVLVPALRPFLIPSHCLSTFASRLLTVLS